MEKETFYYINVLPMPSNVWNLGRPLDACRGYSSREGLFTGQLPESESVSTLPVFRELLVHVVIRALGASSR